ncbi:MAG TPA: nuclear transport factor 2 family protein [Pyrinomonadaceae bacterium]|nr:nuclear transport factor 2 family protein [Pyrinomonadaceae bacterium]
MKYCPKCQTNYADETYEFCLQDGTLLVVYTDAQSSPTVFLDEQQTQVKLKPTEQVQFYPPTQAQDWQSSQVTQIPPPIQTQTPPPKSNTARIVFLTALTMLALFGGGFGAWYFLGGKQTEITQNKNTSSPNSNRTTSPKPSANANTPTLTATPTPTPELDAVKIKSEVTDAINSWKSATENGNINSVMSHYDDSISFYGSQKSRATVRNDKQAAFNKYDSMEITLSNLRVTPDAKGERATAVFDKEWVFTGDKVYAGKVQSEFQFVKKDGKWLITSEKDLKIYYVDK